MPEIEFVIDTENQLTLFKKLLEKEVPADQLSLILRNLYYEYSLMAIRNFRSSGYLADDLEAQLYYLLQIIKVCEGDVSESESIEG